MSITTPAGALEAQVVIPVHSTDRPIRRAVESVIANELVGAVVVAHGLSEDSLDLPRSERVIVVEFAEAQGFPGAAFNAGLRATTAPFVGIMGSDDWYEPGSIARMLVRLRQSGADGILAPLRFARNQVSELNPVTWRRRRLKPARDRLFFRTAPLGLFRREVLLSPQHLMAEGVVAGIDQASSALLYTSGLDIHHYPQDPAYVVGDDAKSRVTTTPRPLSVQGEAWERMWQERRVLSLPPRERRALAEKFVQVHILPAVAARPHRDQWQPGDFEWLAELAARVKELEPKLDRSYVRVQSASLQALVARDQDAAIAALHSSVYLDWRLPAHPMGAFGRNFWLRIKADTWLSRVRDRLGSLGGRRAQRIRSDQGA